MGSKKVFYQERKKERKLMTVNSQKWFNDRLVKKKGWTKKQKRNDKQRIYEAIDRELDGGPRGEIFVEVYIPLRASSPGGPYPSLGIPTSPLVLRPKPQRLRISDDRKAGSSSSFEGQVPVEPQLPVTGPHPEK